MTSPNTFWAGQYTSRMLRTLLWLFVVNLGVAFGAGVYEHRIVVPNWIVTGAGSRHWNAAAARRDDTGLRFWAYVSTGPLTILTLANLYAGWATTGDVRMWWLGAALAALGDRLLTFFYFIPTMIVLLNAADTPAAVATATRWSTLNHVRHALTLGAWLASLKALTLA